VNFQPGTGRGATSTLVWEQSYFSRTKGGGGKRGGGGGAQQILKMIGLFLGFEVEKVCFQILQVSLHVQCLLIYFFFYFRKSYLKRAEGSQDIVILSNSGEYSIGQTKYGNWHIR